MTTTIRSGRKVIGFTYTKADGTHWYAFGKPSQASWIEFSAPTAEEAIRRVEKLAKVAA